ncbi:hypothetical protein D9758_000757 [Tetrapyrgos nigripes]|uniref:Uncharacterized protein n=1 Tax=Tetrapyrgos nigripes TaxID=182062 RepID=A0A8H5LY75_9AGAR|nr:hypothetical protein D9758_000757 [Tetrapyrgos nigripes]
MSISIDIVPLSDSVDMYGEGKTLSAYSLAGNVVISMSTPYLFFNRPSKVLLQSLQLIFEGQSEVWAPGVSYAATRLCSITRELVPSGEPVLLSNEGTEISICQWNVVFNLTIPGWLPPSTHFGVCGTGVSYHLYATAKFVDISDTRKRNSWSFSGIYNSLCSRMRVTDAHKVVRVRRFVRPPTTYDPEETLSCMMFYISPTSPDNETGPNRIPVDVLSKVQVLVSVPEAVNVKDNTLTFTLRLRTKDLAQEHCKRLGLGGFQVDVIQKDRCRSRPTAEYLSRYPLPGPELQPPTVPLRTSAQMVCFYDTLYSARKSEDSTWSRTFSLLPSSETGEYKLTDDTYIFAQDADQTEPAMWYTLQSHIPIQQISDDNNDVEWAGPAVLRPSWNGPLLTVKHEVIIRIPFTYDIPGTDQKAHDSFSFALPLTFVNVAPKLPAPEPSVLVAKPLAPPLGPSTPLESVPLPAYSQLYHSNGDRRIDSTPLPAYTPSSLKVPTVTVRRNSEAFRCILYHPAEKLNGLGVAANSS